MSRGGATIPTETRSSMAIFSNIAAATWEVYLVASPFILLGLVCAGLVHVLVPNDRIARWLGAPGLASTAKAALLGVPLPLCSCSVVPVTIELSRKGASREASLAFLVSTPETGVDSILLTYGLMGPVMAVARPVAALVTSFVAALGSMVWPERGAAAISPPPQPEIEDCCEGETTTAGEGSRTRRALHYGLVEMVDEIGPWLVVGLVNHEDLRARQVVGLVLTGLITALVPEETIRAIVGSGPRALVTLLLLGIPLYMCASASTPIAAALLLKGVSPGAALVFLLAGPATNASSLVLIARFFGKRFLLLFLASVVGSTLLLGWGLDTVLEWVSIDVTPALVEPESEVVHGLALASAMAMALLLVASLVRGSWTAAYRDLKSDLRSWRELL